MLPCSPTKLGGKHADRPQGGNGFLVVRRQLTRENVMHQAAKLMALQRFNDERFEVFGEFLTARQ